MANLAISNVPGPAVPLYLAGARFLTFHPLSIILHGLALNITIQTYAGQVDFGIVADKKALPQANDLAQAIEAAFSQAQALMGSGAAQRLLRQLPRRKKKAPQKAAAKPPVTTSPVKPEKLQPRW